MVDIDNQGGIPVIMKILFEGGFLHGDTMTCNGKTL
jgi:dihydroxy-acid dehydratase